MGRRIAQPVDIVHDESDLLEMCGADFGGHSIHQDVEEIAVTRDIVCRPRLVCESSGSVHETITSICCSTFPLRTNSATWSARQCSGYADGWNIRIQGE